MKNLEKVKQGKKNKRDGAKFELLVRKDLESKGWIVDKWTNNVECIKYNKETSRDPEDWGECKLIPAKHKFCGIGRPMSLGTGFPDFIAFRRWINESFVGDRSRLESVMTILCECIGVEVKSNGYLDKTEREKCKWLLENNIFSKILIASKDGKEIKYEEFK